MSANYLHGLEIIQLSRGAKPANPVKTAVIGLVSVAPTLANANELLLIQSEAEAAAAFGVQHKSNAMRRAITAILKQGAALIVAVNVASSTHFANVTESLTVANGKVRLTHLKRTDVGAPDVEVSGTPLSEGADFAYNPQTQVINIINPTYASGTVLDVSYSRLLDASNVTDGDLIGTTTSSARTGMQLWDICLNTYGFAPKLLISPNFSDRPAVAAELIAKAESLKAHALIDAEYEATVAQVIAGRGSVAGTVKNFYTSSPHAILCYPHLATSDPYTSTEYFEPLSSFLAGCVANTDNNEGYWYSPSNHELNGVVNIERRLTFNPQSANTDVNLLNENGIVTVAAGFGTGWLVWGNRSAMFPADTDPMNFVCVARTAWAMDETIARTLLPFVDKPITEALKTHILQTVDAYLDTQKQLGAIVDGNSYYDPAFNSPAQLAAGQLTICVDFMPPTPAERITIRRTIDTTLLAALNQ